MSVNSLATATVFRLPQSPMPKKRTANAPRIAAIPKCFVAAARIPSMANNKPNRNTTIRLVESPGLLTSFFSSEYWVFMDFLFSFFQVFQPSGGGGKAASAVKWCELRFVVDVQPFDSAAFGLHCAFVHQHAADSISLSVGRDSRVEEKSMHPAITDDFRKAHEAPAFVGADVDEGMP